MGGVSGPKKLAPPHVSYNGEFGSFRSDHSSLSRRSGD